jgi:hypothetical protein
MDAEGRLRLRACVVACAVGLALTACQRGEQQAAPAAGGEMEWARAALERNPRLEVVAVDDDAGVFTVRDKSTGDMRTVALIDLAAAPVSQLTAPAPSAPAAPPDDAQTAAAPEPEPEADEEKPAEATAAATPASGTENYTIERSGDQVRVSGPGVSIVSAGGGENSRGAPGKRNADPIICEGRRMMHLDNRNIYVEGDAIVVRGGCELHITNSHIVASGTGLTVQGAVAHVKNSHIEGATAVYDLDGSAKLYVSGSTMTGMPRRHAYAQVQDLGGNEWRQAQSVAGRP